MDFPRAWEISRSRPISDHHPKCSYRQTTGAIMCDCNVLTQHPEYLRDYSDDNGQQAGGCDE